MSDDDFIQISSFYKLKNINYKPLSMEFYDYYLSLLKTSKNFNDFIVQNDDCYIKNDNLLHCHNCDNEYINNNNLAISTNNMKTSVTHPLNISIIIPLDCIDYMSSIIKPSLTVVDNPINLDYLSSLCYKFHHDINSLTTDDLTYYNKLYSFNQNKSPHLFRFGNLLMSSAPGKKLRLNQQHEPEGQSDLKSPVYRDLHLDFIRIKKSGCNVIACCLDDNELISLGISWSEYKETATKIGLSILRFPMPEGLHPPDLNEFHDRLSILLNDFTFKGFNILVHCRGGVGRAGIIASAWILKMGLIPNLLLPAINNETEHCLSILKSLINVVRLRRSLKAIETFEQVRFIFNFIVFLRKRAGIA